MLCKIKSFDAISIEYLDREGGGESRTLLPSLAVSTKDVHGMWISVWISTQ